VRTKQSGCFERVCGGVEGHGGEEDHGVRKVMLRGVFGIQKSIGMAGLGILRV